MVDFSNDINIINKACIKLIYLEYLILFNITNYKDPLLIRKDALGKRCNIIFFYITHKVIITHYLLLTYAKFKDNVNVL